MKIRMLATIGGLVEGHYDLKRGDTIDIPEEPNAKRMISNGVATAKRAHMKCPVGQLPPPYTVTEESKALEQWARQETLRGVPADIRHRVPGCAEYVQPAPIGGRQRPAQGWIP